MNIFLGLQKKSKSDEKKKLSIDFELNNYHLMSSSAALFRSTNSGIVNYLVEHFLQLSKKAKKAFAKTSSELLASEKKLFSDCDDFEREELANQIAILEDLLLFFTDGKGLPEEEPMKRIEMADGYALIPENWVVINESHAKNCSHAGVIEVRNSAKYNCPHFVFFSELSPNKFDADMQDSILTRCEIVHPDFRRIRAMQLEPIYDENHVLLNAELWTQAPHIGIFEIQTYGIATTFPAGAMVVKQ